MIESMFRTRDLPAQDRFDSWCERMVNLHAPMHLSSDYAADFQAEIRFLQLGAILVWPAVAAPVRLQRTPGLIRKSDPENYNLTYMVRGTKGLIQAGTEGTCTSGDLQIVDSSRPFDCHVVARDAVVLVGVEVPKTLVPLPRKKVDRLVTRRLPGKEGTGGLLTGFLTRLVQDSSSFRATDASWLETALIDLFSATLAHELDAEDALSPETRGRTTAMRVRSFIRQHLHDPHLSPGTIAAAHHISVSYLHRLFRSQGTTVAAYIRHQRLEGARRCLEDPGQRTVPIHHIAARWGFTQHPVFTRAFRATYGLTPSDYRHKAAQL
ncbi:helix-turn-helix domain-containing protein [Streptomyces sp. NPDC004134]|uniref:helix-turn-helix domain-containing protein n=1 Tax=Streptomyces sp. NPDC004134 TaxID=3364691 RepID=UPI0036CA87BC